MRGIFKIGLILSLGLPGTALPGDHEAVRSFRPRPLSPPVNRLYGGGRLSARDSGGVQLADSGREAATYEVAEAVCREVAPAGYWTLPRQLDVLSIGLQGLQSTLWNYSPASPFWLQPERSGPLSEQGRWSFLNSLPRFTVDYLQGGRTARVYCVHPVERTPFVAMPRFRLRR